MSFSSQTGSDGSLEIRELDIRSDQLWLAEDTFKEAEELLLLQHRQTSWY